MGLRSTPDMTALNYGYLSPKLRGRADLDFYDQALDFLLNYIVTPQGEVSYRPGTRVVANTRDNNPARLIPFLFNVEQAYIVEVTEDYMRFYKDNGLITLTPQNITGITKANPAVVTYAGADTYANGDRVFISGVEGMHQVNNREYIVANVNVGANTFELQDVTAANVDSTGYGTYTSGGTIGEIYEIASPYQEADLFELDFAQTNDTMYIVHPDYEPRKLTRSAHTSWTLTAETFVSNPFGITKAASQAITNITQANPAVVTYGGADTYANGDHVFIDGVVGMTEVNGKTFTVANVNTGANTFELQDYDSTLNTGYGSGGTIEEWTAFDYPSVVTLFGGRLIYGASDTYPTRLWFSKILEDGSLNNFITGTLDADAIVYTLRADQANRIRWVLGAESYVALGTSGSEHRIAGGGDNNAITPTNIDVKPTSFNGVAAVKPIRLDSYILYPQRNKKTVRSYEYNALQDGYVSPDRTLLADHIGAGRFKQLSYTAGTPNIIWGVLEDGKMNGLTFDPNQQVVAWHPHNTDGTFESVATIPEANEDDELWLVTNRTINGSTVRFVEYMPNVPQIPIPEDYFTGQDNKAADTATFLTALWNTQKTLLHADCAQVYDGRDATAGINLTITGGSSPPVSGETVTVTASAGFFTAAMATDKRRIQTPDGGQIQITTFTSSTEVDGLVLYDLEGTSFTGGAWYYMFRTIGSLHHLEGETLALLADGGPIAGLVVSNAEVTLDDDAGYVIAGLKYTGIGKTEDVTGADEIGRGQAKPKNITHLGVRYRASLGTKWGTSLYNVENPPARDTGATPGRPPQLFDGVEKIPIDDSWDDQKNIYWLHELPTPSNIQYIQPLIETNER